MRFTIGIRAAVGWEQREHQGCSQIMGDEKAFCDDFFSIFVKCGESVDPNQTVSHTFTPVVSRSDILKIAIYTTATAGVKYVTQPTCKEISHLISKTSRLGQLVFIITLIHKQNKRA